jgi:hypothetical protein
MAQFAEIAFLTTNLTASTFSFNVFIKKCDENDFIWTHTDIPYTDFPVYINIEEVLGQNVECYEYKVVEKKTQLSCSDTVLVSAISPTPTPSITPTTTPSSTPITTPTVTPTVTPTPEPCILDCSLSPIGSPCLISCEITEVFLDCDVSETEPGPLDCEFSTCLIDCQLSVGSSCLLDATLTGSTVDPSKTPSVTLTPTPTPSSSITLRVSTRSSLCSEGNGDIFDRSGNRIFTYNHINVDSSSSNIVIGNERINFDLTSTTINDLGCGLVQTITSLFIDGNRVLDVISPSYVRGSTTDSYSFTPTSSSHNIEIILSAS